MHYIIFTETLHNKSSNPYNGYVTNIFSPEDSKSNQIFLDMFLIYWLGVDRYVFFRADTDTDYYRSSRPITDILNRYTCLVQECSQKGDSGCASEKLGVPHLLSD